MPTTSEAIVRILLKRLREEPLTAEEAATLADWQDESPGHKAFVERMLDEEQVAEKIKELLAQDDQAAWSRIEQAIGKKEQPPVRKIHWYRGAAAAAMIITLSGIAYYYFSRQTSTSISPGATTQVVADIAPGRDRAVLTLSDGSRLNLTDAANGTLAQEQGAKVVKLADGQLEYRGEMGEGSREKVVQYNTLSTPRGGYYQLRLPDNTQVWLNAASSLKYPTSFANSPERRVEITGEAYFEVAKDSKKFRVIIRSGGTYGKPSAPKGEALVLGTHFNIKAYDDHEAATTTLTLLEGKVQVAAYAVGASTASETTDTKILSPGQQVRMKGDDQLTIVKNADLDHVVAWRDGYLSYREADLTTIMREISRWYNVEVVYNTTVNATSTYTGIIPRNITLSKLIKAMNESGVEYTMTIAEGNKLVVTR